MIRRLTVCSALTCFLLGAFGCDAPQCKQMRACCAEMVSEEWVGESCGPMVANIHEPSSCQAVVHAIEAAAAARDYTLPAACGAL